MEQIKQSFLKDHADTLAIIAVNIATAAILVTMWISNAHRVDAANERVDAANARSDQLYMQLAQIQKEGNDKFYEMLRERK